MFMSYYKLGKQASNVNGAQCWDVQIESESAVEQKETDYALNPS